MSYALLRADQRHHLVIRVERHLEAALVPGSDRCPKLGQAVVIGIAVTARIGDRLLRRLDDVRWAGQIRIADAQTDDVEAGCALLRYAPVNLGEQIGREVLDPLRGADRGGSVGAQFALPTVSRSRASSGSSIGIEESGHVPANT